MHSGALLVKMSPVNIWCRMKMGNIHRVELMLHILGTMRKLIRASRIIEELVESKGQKMMHAELHAAVNLYIIVEDEFSLIAYTFPSKLFSAAIKLRRFINPFPHRGSQKKELTPRSALLDHGVQRRGIQP